MTDPLQVELDAVKTQIPNLIKKRKKAVETLLELDEHGSKTDIILWRTRLTDKIRKIDSEIRIKFNLMSILEDRIIKNDVQQHVKRWVTSDTISKQLDRLDRRVAHG